MLFLSLDGVDGVGKSTQLALLVDWLRTRQLEVVVCRDPGSTRLGEALRQIVLQGHDTPIHRIAEMLVYMAARAQLVEEVIRPALAKGKTVVCDRFLLANVVYQGYAGGLDVEQLWSIGEVATGGLHPDLTLVLDLDVPAAQRRLGREPDRMEAQGSGFLERVREGFLIESRLNHERIVVVSAAGDIEYVQQSIRAVVERRLTGRAEVAP
ncbi:MAG: dTMP kinase [Pirellulaceae bacterium]|jgi:dTMP kinase|nr:dTMP kinase [Pirellulaceae bacterium]